MQETSYSGLPLIAMRGIVVIPNERIGFDVGRNMSINAAQKSIASHDGMVILSCQKDFQKIELPITAGIDDIFTVGTLCKITQIIRLPGVTTLRVFVEAISRVEITSCAFSDGTLFADALALEEPACDDTVFETIHRRISALLKEYRQVVPKFSEDDFNRIEKSVAPGAYADMVTATLLQKPEQRQKILEIFDPVLRLSEVYSMLSVELEIAKLDNKIELSVKKQIDKNQREYYLREKIKVIKQELGETDRQIIDDYIKRASEKQFPESVREKMDAEITKLSNLPPFSHEAPNVSSYIELLLKLPWVEKSDDNIDLAFARRILDRDHYGLDKVKDRIIEHLAVGKRTNKLSGQILCLYGPPGVGKTSIACSVAEAVGRKFVRMSLGGIDDESEIRGHRRTYIGAMQGRIISAMMQSQTINPVMLLDEIDKLVKNIHGDPSAAMLEVLDSAQNFAFRDHYLEIPYDLSNVLFITTANSLDTIPRPLLDRMEIIEVPGYLEYEKQKIAAKHLIPKQLEKHALTNKQLVFFDSTLTQIIRGYTHESGVRELERQIANVARKASVELCNGKTQIRLTKKRLEEYLGAPKIKHDGAILTPAVGICNGLAWTAYGGEVLPIEVQTMQGTGKLELTGNLGNVMQESASAALTFIRAHADRLGIADDFFAKNDIHVHALSGAVPKDGPSAGVTITTAMVSAICNLLIIEKLAMTGEISLRGEVLPIGGLREKLLAAIRSGITTVIVPKANKSDVLELDAQITENLSIIYAENAFDVLSAALIKTVKQEVRSHSAPKPLTTSIPL